MKSLILPALATVALASHSHHHLHKDEPLVQQKTCDDWVTFDLPNKLYVMNNKWGKDQATGDSYQCVTANPDGSVQVDYRWVTKPGIGQTVKGYPAMISGWHWGYRYGEGTGNLPARVYNRPKMMTTWNVKQWKKTDFEQMNTSWDIWLGGIDERNPALPDVEVMIWINHVKQYPIGSKVEGGVNIWGQSWDLWKGQMDNGQKRWDVYSFVHTSGTWAVNNQDLFAFFQYLWE